MGLWIHSEERALVGVMALAMAGGGCGTTANATSAAAAPKTQPAKTIDPRWTWDLTELYQDLGSWDRDRRAILDGLAELAKLEGTLNEGPKALLHATKAMYEIYRKALRIYVYASLSGDEDLGDPKGQERLQQAQHMFSELEKALAWYQPEIVSLGKDTIESYLKAEPELSPYAFPFRDAIRKAPHTLSQDAEEILAAQSPLSQAPHNIYGILANSDIPFPTITLSNGEEARIDSQGYARHRGSDNREDRKKVFDAYWGTWDAYKGTVGTVLYSHLQGAAIESKARNYQGTLERQLFADNLPAAVYDTLVRVANENLDTLHRYFRLRAKMLGVKQMHYYDIYPDLVSLDREFSVEDAMELTRKSLGVLGDDYMSKLNEGLDGRWMHVFPSKGKRSGAYMNGSVYDVHPYLLLNHNDDFESVSTFLHEWGHAVHTLLAQEKQPFHLADYSTFVAETASIMNEILLQEDMIRAAKTQEEKLFYLGYALEQMRGTFFRQTMFSEFEQAIHSAVEKGEPLTGERLSTMYGEILKRYHGHNQGVVIVDDLYANEWMFVPHFYYGFYVFQYATSNAGAAWLAERIVQGGEDARLKFIELLAAGGSDYPYELFKKAGLDMAAAEPYEALVRRMNTIMDQMEEILAQRN